MLTRLKGLFSGPRTWPVECFGKLPCYQDYISLVTTRGATVWRDWLLATFRGDNLPPDGVWRFLFAARNKGEPVVGLIQASSDGRREFPFSLFVVGDRRLNASAEALQVVWEDLASLHWQLVASPSVQGVYSCCAGRKVTLEAGMTSGREAMVQDGGSWPRLLVAASGDAADMRLLWQAGMDAESLQRNWRTIAG